jgi:type II secretory pathway pseudopilin PulG
MELLVVITIMVILTAAMIPVMSVASDARRLREGARLVSTMLASAQSRAVSSGRSVGVLFQPMKNNPYACMEMYMVESPQPYSGDTNSYRAAISGSTVTINDGTIVSGKLGRPTFSGVPMADQKDPSNAPNQTLIRPGDLIQFNYRGQMFVLNFGDNHPYAVSNDPNTLDNPNWQCVLTLTPTDPSASLPPATPTGSTGVPFTIFRQPVKTFDPPAQLSDGVAVDWFFSGVNLAAPQPLPGGPTGAAPTNYPNGVGWPSPAYQPPMFGACGTIAFSGGTPSAPGHAAMANTCGGVIVSFSPSGSLDQVYFSCCYPDTPTPTAYYSYQSRPLSGVYFLVGKIEKIPSAGPTFNDSNVVLNYRDPDCRWVTATRQSGLVTTSETAPVAAPTVSGTPIPDWAKVLNAVMASRRYASGNQSSGGI